MRTVIQALKSAYGDYRLVLIYLLCLLLLVLFFRGKRRQFAIPALFISIIVTNPLFYEVWSSLNETRVYYWRALWIIPILPVCSAVLALAVDKTKKEVVNLGILFIGTMIMILCGKSVNIYANPITTFNQASNAEKLPEYILNIGEAIFEIDTEPYVVTDSTLSVYLRQYSAKIHSPYSRSVVYGSPNQLGKSMYSALISEDYSTLGLLMANNGYQYLVTENRNEEKQRNLAAEKFELVRQVDDYGIYRNYHKKTEIRVYNDLHQVTSVTTVDEMGNPINNINGIATYEYEYDENGGISFEFHRNAEGKAAVDNEGRAGYKREYNYLGQITKETNLNSEGKPIVIGYATKRCEYNLRHLLCRETYYDENDNPMLRIDKNCACMEIEYNELNCIISERYYGLSGEAIPCDRGFAEIEYVRDKIGNAVEEYVYDTEHHLTICSDGYSIVKRRFDETRLISERYYDVQGEPIDTKYGYSIKKRDYLNNGELSLTWYYDSDENRVELGSSWFHEYLQSLMNRNVLIILSVKDDGVYSLTRTIMEDLSELGIQTDLFGKYMYSYYAVVSSEICCEEMSDSATIYGKYEIDNNLIEVKSGGYMVGNTSSIIINGTEYSQNKRGMNVVVLDLNTGELIDSVSWDTHTELMQMTR